MSHSRTQSPSYTWSTDHDKGLGVREWVARLIAPHLLQLQIKMSCLCVCYFKTSACVIYLIQNIEVHSCNYSSRLGHNKTQAGKRR
jgi:hypothetical protein